MGLQFKNRGAFELNLRVAQRSAKLFSALGVRRSADKGVTGLKDQPQKLIVHPDSQPKTV